MPDWSSLKPLKTQSTVLTIVAMFLIAVLIFTPRHAFKLNSSNSFAKVTEGSSIVIAESGLSIRDQPNKNGNLLITAPYQSKLSILEINIAQDYINGKSGYWYKVEFKGTVGFAFGNYIEK